MASELNVAVVADLGFPIVAALQIVNKIYTAKTGGPMQPTLRVIAVIKRGGLLRRDDARSG